MKQTLKDALEARGYHTLTPVQEAVSDPTLEGCDLLVSAQTGSGKTLGFGLAIASQILGTEETFGAAASPLALIIAPTRELALQVKRELAWLYAGAGAVLASCVGGMDMRDERRALARGAHIVVATPGRLRDHIMRGSIQLGELRSVVLDEADEMLDLGFREDLEFILAEAPTDRQTLLFSATVPHSIARLAESYQRDAQRIVTRSETTQHADITYQAMAVAEPDTEKAVINTLLYHRAPNAIVFANTRATVNRLTTRLSNRGFRVVALSGELSQAERTHALQAMRDGRADVCVATDVAARGIDLPNLDLVVHAELPNSHETLLHRSGRTGRAGRKGTSAMVVTRKNRRKAERILQGAKVRAEWGSAPDADSVTAREQERIFADESWQEPAEEGQAEIIAKLVEQFSPEQIATAYLRLQSAQSAAPEELSDPEAPPPPKAEFGPSVWFSVTGGRQAGAEPRRVLPMLLRAGQMEKDDVGAIRIRETESFVQLRAGAVPGFLTALGDAMLLEEGAEVRQLAEPPQMGGAPAGAKPKAPYKGKPDRKGPPRAAPETPRADTPPTDWNDDPAPRPRKPKPQDRPAAQGKPKPQGGKPSFGKPAGGKPAGGKPTGAKPTGGKPTGGKPAGSKPDGGKPAYGKAAGGKAPYEKGPRAGRDGKADQASGEKPAVKAGKPRMTLKGPTPPPGKANSKKNLARADAKNAARREGGKFPPKRPKS
ncbi:MAG: DEAD/DEAH box helicase [Sulfitobacter sp.]|nr:DEAD/DEAH box helicase [Sulfitobacter sp.]